MKPSYTRFVEATDQEFYNKIRKIPKYGSNPQVTLSLIQKLASLDPDTTIKADGRITRVGSATETLLDFYLKADSLLVKKLKTATGRTFLKQLLEKYARFKKALKSFGFSGLIQDCESMEQVQQHVDLIVATDQRRSDSSESISLKDNRNVIVWDENEEWIVASPLNRAGAIYLGRNSSWCTARKSTSHYYSIYNSKGRLFVFINKRTRSAFQYCNADLNGTSRSSLNNEQNQALGRLPEWAAKNNVPEEWVLAVQSAKFSKERRDGKWYTRARDLKALQRERNDGLKKLPPDPSIIGVRNAIKTIIATDWRILNKKLASDFAFKDWASARRLANWEVTDDNLYVNVYDWLIRFPNSESWKRIPSGEWLSVLNRAKFDKTLSSQPGAEGHWFLDYHELIQGRLNFPKSVTLGTVEAYKRDLENIAKDMMSHRGNWTLVKDVSSFDQEKAYRTQYEEDKKFFDEQLGEDLLDLVRNVPSLEAMRTTMRIVHTRLSGRSGYKVQPMQALFSNLEQVPKENIASFAENVMKPKLFATWEKTLKDSIAHEVEKYNLDRLAQNMSDSLVKLGLFSKQVTVQQLESVPVLLLFIGNELDYLNDQLETNKSPIDWWGRYRSSHYTKEVQVINSVYQPDKTRIPDTQADIDWDSLTWDLEADGELFYNLRAMIEKDPRQAEQMISKIKDFALNAFRSIGLSEKDKDNKLQYMVFEQSGVTASNDGFDVDGDALFAPLFEFWTKVMYLTWYVTGVRDFFVQLRSVEENEVSEEDAAYEAWQENRSRLYRLSTAVLSGVASALFPSGLVEAEAFRVSGETKGSYEYISVLPKLYAQTGNLMDLISYQLISWIHTPNKYRQLVYDSNLRDVVFSADLLPYTKALTSTLYQPLIASLDTVTSAREKYRREGNPELRDILRKLSPLSDQFTRVLAQYASELYAHVGHPRVYQMFDLMQSWLAEKAPKQDTNG